MAKKKTGSSATPPASAKPPRFVASICPGDKHELPMKFVTAINGLEKELNLPVWLLIQGDEPDSSVPFGSLDWPTLEMFVAAKESLPKQKIALVIDSPGGQADVAYQLAMILRRRCGSFMAIIPRWAKSAATLLSLAADEIYLGEDGQLGPLDVQIYDADKEERYSSALDEVGAIGELEEAAINAASAS